MYNETEESIGQIAEEVCMLTHTGTREILTDRLTAGALLPARRKLRQRAGLRNTKEGIFRRSGGMNRIRQP